MLQTQREHEEKNYDHEFVDAGEVGKPKEVSLTRAELCDLWMVCGGICVICGGFVDVFV